MNGKQEEKAIIVYRSKGEKALDEWMWDNGGNIGAAIPILCVVFAVGVFFLAIYAIWTRPKS